MIEYTVKVYGNGDRKWFLNGEYHREDGPAIEIVNGSKYWYLNNKLHREDGPAIERSSGTKEWFLNGKFHREDGPACEYASGNKFWYLNGKELTEEKFLQRTKKHTIIIDGQDILISEESFQNLKNFLLL